MDEARQLPGRAAIRMQIRGGADARRKLQPRARTPDREIITAVRYDRAAAPDCGQQTFPPPPAGHRRASRGDPHRVPRPSQRHLPAPGGALSARPLLSRTQRRRRHPRRREGGGTEGRSAAPRCCRLPARLLARSVPPSARTWVGAGGQLTGCAPIGCPAAAAPSARGGARRGHAHSPRSSPRSPAPRRAAGAGAGSVKSSRTPLRAPVVSLLVRTLHP